MRLLYFFPLIFLFFKLSSCDDSLPKPTGKIGEILVVCDEGIWNSPVKAELDSGLTRFIMPYFPDVATFELIHRTKGKFEGAFKRYRNVILLKIDPTCKPAHGKVVYRRDVWAIRQLVVEITARNRTDLARLCSKHADKVHSEFDEIEWDRIRRHFAKNQDEFINKKISSHFGIQLELPDGSSIVSSRTNFFRIKLPVASRPIEYVGTGKQDDGKVFSGVMIYQYPYSGPADLSLKNLLSARDTMLRYNVPHEIDGLYMGTQYDPAIFPELSDDSNYNGSVKGKEMRGMYVFTGLPGHYMGGAFWSFHFVHPKTKKIVCISGYVDAPHTTSWTHFLREIQAIWKSVTIA